MPDHRVQITRAPVLTLWAAVAAERLGYDRAAALTLGRAGYQRWSVEAVRVRRATGDCGGIRATYLRAELVPAP